MMVARGEVACGDGGGGSCVSARGESIAGEPGTEVRGGHGSMLQMPSTPVPTPISKGHEVKVQGGHSLTELPSGEVVDVVSSVDGTVPPNAAVPTIIPTATSGSPSTQLNDSEQFVYSEKYHAWMPSSADPDEWAQANLGVPPPPADDWELV